MSFTKPYRAADFVSLILAGMYAAAKVSLIAKTFFTRVPDFRKRADCYFRQILTFISGSIKRCNSSRYQEAVKKVVKLQYKQYRVKN